MPDIQVLVEIPGPQPYAQREFTQKLNQRRNLRDSDIGEYLPEVKNLGIELDRTKTPTPMLGNPQNLWEFRQDGSLANVTARSIIYSGLWAERDLNSYENRPGEVRVWNNSELTSPDLSGTGCSSHIPVVDLEDVRLTLGLSDTAMATDCSGITVGIIDDGINHDVYPVANNDQDFSWLQNDSNVVAGQADIGSHGSMCAAAIQICAPNARIYDFPVFPDANSAKLLNMLNWIISERGSNPNFPRILSNSFSFSLGPRNNTDSPFHETRNRDHPINRKYQELANLGCTVVFAAGNCGSCEICGDQCADMSCGDLSIGSGNSIHGPNSLPEVITVGAVDINNQRLGYSSQGAGYFLPGLKPDLMGYTHYRGNFGEMRPGGRFVSDCDKGTSAAAPQVAGLAALIMAKAFPVIMSPDEVYECLRYNQKVHDPNMGYATINASLSLRFLEELRNGNWDPTLLI